MPTSVECVCCMEMEPIMEKMQEDNIDEECVLPITSWIFLLLQAPYFNYRQQHGTEGLSPSVNERVVVPACAVTNIRVGISFEATPICWRRNSLGKLCRKSLHLGMRK